MTREDARKAAEVMLAYADEKEIEIKKGDKWFSSDEVSFNWFDFEYRVKPESKYRPFESVDECWQEMLKHKPFGWIAKSTRLYAIKTLDCNTVFIDDGCENRSLLAYFKDSFYFADGTPFGVKEE